MIEWHSAAVARPRTAATEKITAWPFSRRPACRLDWSFTRALSPSRGDAVDCLLDDACIESGAAVSAFICLFLPSAINAKQELHSFQNRTPGAPSPALCRERRRFCREDAKCLPPASTTKRFSLTVSSRAFPAFIAAPAAYRWSRTKRALMLISEVSRA